jgi:hypothetical protein
MQKHDANKAAQELAKEVEKESAELKKNIGIDSQQKNRLDQVEQALHDIGIELQLEPMITFVMLGQGKPDSIARQWAKALKHN